MGSRQVAIMTPTGSDGVATATTMLRATGDVLGTLIVHFTAGQPAAAKVDLVLVPFAAEGDLERAVSELLSADIETAAIATATKTAALNTAETVLVQIKDGSDARYLYVGDYKLKVASANAAPDSILASVIYI